eukprot:403360258
MVESTGKRSYLLQQHKSNRPERDNRDEQLQDVEEDSTPYLPPQIINESLEQRRESYLIEFRKVLHQIGLKTDSLNFSQRIYIETLAETFIETDLHQKNNSFSRRNHYFEDLIDLPVDSFTQLFIDYLSEFLNNFRQTIAFKDKVVDKSLDYIQRNLLQKFKFKITPAQPLSFSSILWGQQSATSTTIEPKNAFQRVRVQIRQTALNQNFYRFNLFYLLIQSSLQMIAFEFNHDAFITMSIQFIQSQMSALYSLFHQELVKQEDFNLEQIKHKITYLRTKKISDSQLLKFEYQLKTRDYKNNSNTLTYNQLKILKLDCAELPLNTRSIIPEDEYLDIIRELNIAISSFICEQSKYKDYYPQYLDISHELYDSVYTNIVEKAKELKTQKLVIEMKLEIEEARLQELKMQSLVNTGLQEYMKNVKEAQEKIAALKLKQSAVSEISNEAETTTMSNEDQHYMQISQNQTLMQQTILNSLSQQGVNLTQSNIPPSLQQQTQVTGISRSEDEEQD